MKARHEAVALMVVSALLVVAAWIRLRALLATPFPTGVDGYWYLIEVRSLLEQGRLAYPSAPLVPWLMAAAALVLGPVLAVKVVAALGSALLVVPSYLVAKRITGVAGPALVGAALVATSAQSFFLATEFVKQAVGLSLAMAFVAALAAAIERPGWVRGGLAVALLAACALTHKTAIGLAVIAGAPVGVANLWPRHKRALALAGLAVLALGSWAVGLGAHNALAPLGHLLRGRADFSFAVLNGPGRDALVLGREVAVAAGLAVVALGLAAIRKPEKGVRLPPLAVGFICFAMFQALPWLDIADDQGLGYRLRLCACFCLGPCAALVVAHLARGVAPRLRTPLLALAVCLVLALRPWSSEEGVIKVHPAMVQANERLAAVLPVGATVIVPERHTAFMAAWYARAEVRLRPPPVLDPDRTFRLLPGAAIRPGLWAALDELRAHPAPGIAPVPVLHPLHPNGLVFLPERTFRYFSAKLPSVEQQWYEAWVVQ